MCNTVVAYKSKNGHIYESQAECNRQDSIYLENYLIKQAEGVFDEAFRKGFKHYPYGDNIRNIQMFARGWKDIRDALNRIQE